MPKLLQINVTANWGSTGRIAEEIGILAMQKGWESYIAYGRYANPSASHLIKIGTQADVYAHYLENRLFDNEGRASRMATMKLVRDIKRIQPDIIHLHNIHDHYINYPILFAYLNTVDVPIVWTQHDCWAFSGGCMYYSILQCEQWKTGCNHCKYKRGLLTDKTQKQYRLKKKLFTAKKITIVPVSKWLEEEVRTSFLSSQTIHTIRNGVDTHTFMPSLPTQDIRTQYRLGNHKLFMAAATKWSERKGFKDYVSLSRLLKSDERIVLVGITKKQAADLPDNIIALPQVQTASEMAQLYNAASIVLNLSYEETFGLTTAEGLACGTPSVVYRCTASPELVSPETGIVVPPGNIDDVYLAIKELLTKEECTLTTNCRKRALELYDQKNCFNQYLSLYQDLLTQKNAENRLIFI